MVCDIYQPSLFHCRTMVIDEIQKIKFVLTTPRKNLTSMINIYKNFVLNDILFFYFREIAELSNKNCRYLASQIVFPCSALIFSKINVFYVLTK